MMNTMSNRSRILVDPAVQWSIAGRIIGHWAMLLLCLVTINMMVGLLTAAGQTSFVEGLKTAAMSQTRTLVVMFLLVPLFLRDTLKLSNRFAGPMYRLRVALKSMSGGEIPAPIKFRTGDFWLEAADDFNIVLAKYQKLEEENAALKTELEELREEQVAV